MNNIETEKNIRAVAAKVRYNGMPHPNVTQRTVFSAKTLGLFNVFDVCETQ